MNRPCKHVELIGDADNKHHSLAVWLLIGLGGLVFFACGLTTIYFLGNILVEGFARMNGN